jgi:8-oxo-dGTP pyrophosphatase MutT (NUDIX family)
MPMMLLSSQKKFLDRLSVYQARFSWNVFEENESTKIRTFVEQNQEFMCRNNHLGHLTGSAWILNEARDAFLLHHHRKLDKWLQLGGHVDEGEDIMEASLREAKEESGIEELKLISSDIFDVDVHEIPARPEEPSHYHYDIRFLLQAPKNVNLVQQEAESLSLIWVPIKEFFGNPLFKSIQRMGEKSLPYLA